MEILQDRLTCFFIYTPSHSFQLILFEKDLVYRNKLPIGLSQEGNLADFILR